MKSSSVMGWIGAVWGISGLCLLFGRALGRLFPYARELEFGAFSAIHWVAFSASILFIGFAEGYKGFHSKFSPRAAARALYLKNNPTPTRVIFAPFFCMGYFHATKKRKIVSYVLTAVIISLILLVRKLEQPWRGIVDAGVLIGLGWGLLSTALFAVKALFGKTYSVLPETPGV